jgi:DNA-binding LacI/PurR family transcriptional regulator
MPHNRVTLRDIAEKAGVHFTTVSMAMRHHRSIPKSTRDRILKIAERMGYTPDPVLGALMSYRSSKRQPKYQATLAWITNYNAVEGWSEVPIFEEYYLGAKEEATKRGYGLEKFWLKEEGMTARRMSEILRNRGIQGILLAPQQWAGTRLELEWDTFCTISFGQTLESPVLNSVSNNHFRSMVLLMEELFRRGYRRCGLVEEKRINRRVAYAWWGGFQVAHEAAHRAIEVKPLELEHWNEEAFMDWFLHYKPLVVISKYTQAVECLRGHGFRVPEDVGFTVPSLPDRETVFSGMLENAIKLGQSSIRYLSGLIHLNERGIPETPERIMIDGTWFEGQTVLPQAPQG